MIVKLGPVRLPAVSWG